MPSSSSSSSSSSLDSASFGTSTSSDAVGVAGAAGDVSSSLLLSRLLINPLRPEAQQDLVDCQRMHSRLLSAFPDDADVTQARTHYGLLYRVEWEPTTGGVVVLAQSRAAPAWSRLPDGYLLASAEVKSLATLYERLHERMTLRFRLHANPTRRIRASNQQEEARWRGKRVHLRAEEAQLDWLRRKGEAHGFTPLDVQTRPYQQFALRPLGAGGGDHHGSHQDRSQNRSQDAGERGNARRGRAGSAVSGMRAGTGALTFGSVIFDGHLRVSDMLRFREALETGIGAGKAYGFGMLSIAPSHTGV